MKPITRRQRDRAMVAHHEAGHAVVAMRLHQTPRLVSIVRGTDKHGVKRRGHVGFRKPFLKEGDQYDKSLRAWNRNEHTIMKGFSPPFATSMRLYFSKCCSQNLWGQLVLIAVQTGIYRGPPSEKWQHRSNR